MTLIIPLSKIESLRRLLGRILLENNLEYLHVFLLIKLLHVHELTFVMYQLCYRVVQTVVQM